MNRKLIAALLVGCVLTSFVGCSTENNNRSEVTSTKNIKEEQKDDIGNKDEDNQTETNMRSVEERKADTLEMIPDLLDDIETLLVENSTKIHEDFDLSNKQILLVSNTIKTAYLINNQNEELGGSDEVIEYSKDTITDESILTGFFGTHQFNGEETYVFNLDTFAKYTGGEKTAELIFDTIVHEGIHMFLQKENLEDVKTAEASGGMVRSQEYPVPADERIIRAQCVAYLKAALLSEDEDERIENIEKANYYYKEYLEFDEENKQSTQYDMIEGQARYLEFRAEAVLENPDASEEEIIERTTELYVNNYKGLNDDAIAKMGTQGEYYTVGSAAYALLYDMGYKEELGFDNPLQFLLDEFGYEEADGYQEIEDLINEEIDAKNDGLKEYIDTIDERRSSDDYINISIPTGGMGGSMRLSMTPIRYELDGEEVSINKMTVEIQIGGDRVKLDDALLVWNKKLGDNGMMRGLTYEISVPKESVEIDGDRITVQSQELQMYNMKFEEKDGVYTLVE